MNEQREQQGPVMGWVSFETQYTLHERMHRITRLFGAKWSHLRDRALKRGLEAPEKAMRVVPVEPCEKETVRVHFTTAGWREVERLAHRYTLTPHAVLRRAFEYGVRRRCGIDEPSATTA